MTDRPETTAQRLARELRAVAAIASPGNAARYEALAVRADAQEFCEYFGPHPCGVTALHAELMAAGLTKFAARVAAGEFDATLEESDAWARSAEGQAAAKALPPEARPLFGLSLLN